MDLNLLRVFVAIYETQSLTRAADRLFVTQSAVSQSLARLRREMTDPLFERAGRNMEPTQLAERIFPTLRDAVIAVDGVLREVHGFDPASTTRRFRIAMSALGEIGWLPRLAMELGRMAPNAQLEVVALDPQLLPGWLDRGTVDVAISPADLPATYARTAVKSQQYAVVMSAKNPFATTELDLDGYAAAPHVAVLGDTAAPLVTDAEGRAGAAVGPSVAMQHFATIPALLLERPDLLATVPAPIGEGWASTEALVVRPLPFAMDPLQIRVYRRSTTNQAGALEWFYDLTCRVVAATSTPFEPHTTTGVDRG